MTRLLLVQDDLLFPDTSYNLKQYFFQLEKLEIHLVNMTIRLHFILLYNLMSS